MSVNYRSGIALGWLLTGEEVKAFSIDSFKDLINNGRLFPIDHYFVDGSNYIFGIVFKTTEQPYDIVGFSTNQFYDFVEKATPKALDLWHTHLPGLTTPNHSLILYLEVG